MSEVVEDIMADIRDRPTAVFEEDSEPSTLQCRRCLSFNTETEDGIWHYCNQCHNIFMV